MIDFYTWSTSNGRKIAIALEEMGLAYNIHPINIYKDEQFAPDYVAISANAKIPAIIDQETGHKLFESGAILLYLAEKTGQFLPSDMQGKYDTIQWLMWQMGGFGPMLGQAAHFLQYNPGSSEYSAARYGKEAQRLYGVLERQLEGKDYIVGDQLTIADFSIWPWVSRYEHQKIDLIQFPTVRNWFNRLAQRPAFIKGFKVPDHSAEIPQP